MALGVTETPLTKETVMVAPGGPFHDLAMNTPAGRYGKLKEIGKAVAFSASDNARWKSLMVAYWYINYGYKFIIIEKKRHQLAVFKLSE